MIRRFFSDWGAWLVAGGAGAGVLVTAWTATPRGAPPPAPEESATAAKTSDIVLFIPYQPDPSEWRSERPTLCNIARRFDLNENQRIATLWLNGSNGRCANAGAPVSMSRSVKIALHGLSTDRCPAAATQCPADDAALPQPGASTAATQ